MRTVRKCLLYTLYVLLLVVGFGYYLFPSDAIKGALESRSREVLPEFRVSIQDLGPAFPPGLAMRGVRFFYKNREIAVAKTLIATPSFQSLYRLRPVVVFKGQVHDGYLKGEAEAGDAERGDRIRMTLSALRLEKTPALRKLAGFSVSGGLDFKSEFRFSGDPGKFPGADILVRVSGAAFSKPTLPSSLRQLTLKRLEAKFIAGDGRVHVERLTAAGNEADARMIGWIDVKRPLGESVINLSGEIRPHAVFLANLEKDYPGLPALAGKSASSGFSFRIDGVMDNPGYSLKQQPLTNNQ